VGVWLAGRFVGSGVGLEIVSSVRAVGVGVELTRKGVGRTVRSGLQACSSRLAMMTIESVSERGGNHMDAILLQWRNRPLGLLRQNHRKAIICLPGTNFATEVFDYRKI
jgi:hypothetical protein